MYKVTVFFEDGQKWENVYDDIETATDAMYEVTEFGADGCIISEITGEILITAHNEYVD